MSHFKSCQNKGIHIKFANGYTISIQFGFGNYSSAYTISNSTEQEQSSAEIAYWHESDSKMIEFEESGDCVLGYQTPNQVLVHMNRIASLVYKGE